MVVKKGDKVKVQYEGTLNDGTVSDKSREDAPLEFTVGSGEMIPGFDKAVQGMDLNEEKKFTIESKEAYGKKNEALIRQFPKTSLPEDFEPEKGMGVSLQDPEGRSIPAVITDISDDEITIDLNHPLADKDLTFDIKVVGIE